MVAASANGVSNPSRVKNRGAIASGMTNFITDLRGWLALVWLALSIAPGIVSAQESAAAIELPTGNTHVQAFDQMQVRIAPRGALDLDKALSNPDEFKPVTTRWIDFGPQDGGVWLRMTVANTSPRAGEWMLDIQRPFVDELLVAKLRPDGSPEKLLQADANTDWSERSVASQYWVAPLWMEAGETAEILVGVRSSGGSWMPLTFATAERMRTAHMQESRFNWLINGAIAAMIAAALAMGRLVGWRLSLSFAAYAGAGALFVANNEGYLHQFMWPGQPQWFAPLNAFLLPAMAAAGLEFARRFVDLARLEGSHNRRLIGFEIALLVLAVIAAFAWHSPILQTVIYAAIGLAALAYLALGLTAWRAKVLGGVPFLTGTALLGLTLIFMAAVLAMPGRLPLTVALDYFHATLLLESFAFFIAIVVRMLAMQQRLNQSLTAEVAATQAKLELEEALRHSREKYDAAKSKAEQMRNRLASTSHDLQQPLLALRGRLRQLQGGIGAQDQDVTAALDYLETVTERGLRETAPDNPLAGEQPDEGAETFPISIALDNCAAMFSSEAESAGVELSVEHKSELVTTDPVELMRALSNLISNALKHGQASTISVSTGKSGDQLAITIADNGVGMSPEVLEQAMQPYSKGADSAGHGLGLALVRQFGSQAAHGFECASQEGRGTTFTLLVPAGDSEMGDQPHSG